MKNLIVIAVVTTLIALSVPAHAIVVAEGTNTYNGIIDGCAPNPAYQLTIAYEVTETSGVYNYDYTLTTTPVEDLTSFTIGGRNDPIDTQTLGDMAYGLAIPAGSGFNNNSVGWDWGFNPGVTADTVGFSSDLPPGLATYTANDDDIEWSSPDLIPAPVPEPSTLALLAGAAAVFGFVTFRRAKLSA